MIEVISTFAFIALFSVIMNKAAEATKDHEYRMHAEDWAIVSACKGNDKDAENTEYLYAELIQRFGGLNVIQVKGVWKDQQETSFLVFTDEYIVITYLAEKYRQDAILTNEALVELATGKITPVKDLVFDVNGDSYTELPSGIRFEAVF